MLVKSLHIAHATPTLRKPVHDPLFSCQLSVWRNCELDLSHPNLGSGVDTVATHYGYVQAGRLTLTTEAGSYSLESGMYFSVPGTAHLSGDGVGFVATRLGYRGFFQIGGPCEEQGRLKYIDGCSDSLLIGPALLGDPCLNLLYLPPRTEQTAHTHPSCRLGIIASGEGICRSPNGDLHLLPGMVFEIAPDALHSFHTTEESIRVIAWHPDSDCGPSHHDHPMINRTIIAGQSARFRNLPLDSDPP